MPRRQTSAKAKAEVAKAEDAIRAATEAVKNGTAHEPAKVRRTSIDKKVAELGITADDIVRERDTRGLSWRQVGTNLNLGSPSAARAAYTFLTGKSHHDSVMTGKRAPRGAANRAVAAPGWDDDSDQEAIETALNGEWIEESGSGKTYTPAHWHGSLINVRRTLSGNVCEEEVRVKYVTEFTFGPQGDQPLQVWVVAENGAARCFRVADIIEVR